MVSTKAQLLWLEKQNKNKKQLGKNRGILKTSWAFIKTNKEDLLWGHLVDLSLAKTQWMPSFLRRQWNWKNVLNASHTHPLTILCPSNEYMNTAVTILKTMIIHIFHSADVGQYYIYYTILKYRPSYTKSFMKLLPSPCPVWWMERKT